MASRHTHREPDELETALRALRPQLAEDRLDRIASRTRAAAVSHDYANRKESFLRSRFAIVLMLVLGFAFSGTGAGLAVSGIAGDDEVTAQGQYGADNEDTLQPGNEVAGEQESSPAGGTQPTSAAQPARQLAAQSGSELPFTGFAAIPVLLLGVALLTTGFVVRRGSRSSGS